jgi:alkylation response protein AidB-like acyl-CoA dehydrogenase
MDFRLGPRSEAFREEVRAVIGEHLSPEVVHRSHVTGTMHDWPLHRAVAARGWMAASWPVEQGGQDRDPVEMLPLVEEMELAGWPFDGYKTTMAIASIVREFATEYLWEQILRPALAGEILLCLGYSEPDSGSDVAAARTTATRDGETWVVNGSKMWTTLAHESSYVFLLTRTNGAVAKHRGLTMFLVPLDADGVEIHPIHTLGGERTNVTFYTDVRIPDSLRVGEVNGGWDVMKVALAQERSGGGRGEADLALSEVVEWARTAHRDGHAVIDDPRARDRLARVAVRNEVAKLLGNQVAWMSATGAVPGVEGSMHKVFWSENLVRTGSELLDLLGPEGVLQEDAQGSPAGGIVEHLHRHAAVTTIYAGTNEIQRSIIAERGLGLPRGRLEQSLRTP